MAPSQTEDDFVDLFNDLDLDPIIAYCHGGATNIGTENCYGGLAFYFPDEQDEPVAEAVNREDDGPNVNHVRAQYLAALRAIEFANEIDNTRTRKLIIYTNETNLINTMKTWIFTWNTSGDVWIKKNSVVKNQDILKSICRERGRRRIEWTPVEENERRWEKTMQASRAGMELANGDATP